MSTLRVSTGVALHGRPRQRLRSLLALLATDRGALLSSHRRTTMLEVHYHENWSHGWLLFRPSEQEKLITKIQIMALASKSSSAVNNSSTHNSQKSFGSPTASTVPSSPRHRRTHSMHERHNSSSIKSKDDNGKEEGSGGESMMMMGMMLPTVGSTPSTLDALHDGGATTTPTLILLQQSNLRAVRGCAAACTSPRALLR